jgi:murein DD-endopeptidase MepM/ murein hydrolase activator NlpD
MNIYGKYDVVMIRRNSQAERTSRGQSEAGDAREHMGKLRKYLRQSFTSVTIMIIPHSRQKPLRLKVSALGLFCCICLVFVGAGYVVSEGVRTAEYYGMKKRLSYFSSQLVEVKSAMFTLRKTESEFAKLLSLNSKKKILEQADTSSDMGSIIDVELLKKQVRETIESVSEIREYVKQEKNLYEATPTGWPVKGQISSPFGPRIHPITGERSFHSGVDIRTPPGTPVRATANGIVSFADWRDDTGYCVVLEHGHGFTTVYAHNRALNVKVGQRVRRGEEISLSGSTGSSTGPHVHYEVWKEGVHVNPSPYLKDLS